MAGSQAQGTLISQQAGWLATPAETHWTQYVKRMLPVAPAGHGVSVMDVAPAGTGMFTSFPAGSFRVTMNVSHPQAAGTVQEEVGCRGAITAVEAAKQPLLTLKSDADLSLFVVQDTALGGGGSMMTCSYAARRSVWKK